MTQAQWAVLLLKIFLISGFCSLTAWVAVYTKLAHWWADPIGRTLVAKTCLIALLFVPATLSLFFTVPPLVIAWVDTVLIGLVTPVMVWRTVVWLRISRFGKDREGPST